MSKVNLTDRFLKAAKPAPVGMRLIHWDAAQPALGLRVTDRGKKSFVVVRRVAGSNKLHYSTLGSYPELSLAEARRGAPEVLRTLAAGKTPIQARAEAAAERRRAEEERRTNAFSAVAEEYIKRRVSQRKSAKDREEVEKRIRRELIGRWGDRPIAEITQRDMTKIRDEIIDLGGEREPGRRRKVGGEFAARHALADAKALFNWAIESGILERSPADRVRNPKVKPRKRVLKDEELCAIWIAAAEASYPYGPIVRMLILTGQRLNEIARARWSEIDLDDPNEGAAAVLTITPDRMKEEDGHTVPLTPCAVELLRSISRQEGCDFVFSNFEITGKNRPFSGFSKAKSRLDAAGSALLGEPIPHWTQHDIRRTVRTRLGRERVPMEIAEMVIAHKKEGIEGIYNLHAYDEEKREALVLWERRLLSIVRSQ
jgi:integrase